MESHWVVPVVGTAPVIPDLNLSTGIVVVHVTVFTTFRTEHTFTMVVIGVGERRTRPGVDTGGHVTVDGFSEGVGVISNPPVGVGESHVGRVVTGFLIKHLDVVPSPVGVHDTGIFDPVVSVITGVPVAIGFGRSVRAG